MNRFEQIFLKFLANIDGMFQGKKPTEKLILFLLFPMIFGAAAYLFAIPESEKMLRKNQQIKSQLQNSINRDQSYIASVTASKTVEKLKSDIDKATEEIEGQFTIQEDAENKLLNIMVKQKPWADLLQFIAETARKKKIQVDSIKTEKNTETDVLDFDSVNITIAGEANFNNLMLFINEIEEYGIFVQIKKVDIKLDKLLSFSLNINSRRMVL